MSSWDHHSVPRRIDPVGGIAAMPGMPRGGGAERCVQSHNVSLSEIFGVIPADQRSVVCVARNSALPAEHSGGHASALYIRVESKVRTRCARRKSGTRRQSKPLPQLEQLVCIQYSTLRQVEPDASTAAIRPIVGCTSAHGAERLSATIAMTG